MWLNYGFDKKMNFFGRTKSRNRLIETWVRHRELCWNAVGKVRLRILRQTIPRHYICSQTPSSESPTPPSQSSMVRLLQRYTYIPTIFFRKHLHLYFCVWLVSAFLFDCRSLWCLRTELGKRGLQPLCQNGNCIFFDYPSDFIARWVMGWSQNLIFLWFAQVITHLSIGLEADFAFIFGLELILAFDYRGFANMGMLVNIFIPRTISRIQLLKGYQVNMPKTICLSS